MAVAQIISILLSIKWKQNMTDERGNCLISRGSFPGENCRLLGSFRRKVCICSPPGAGAPYKTPLGALPHNLLPAAATASVWVSRDRLRLIPTELLLSPMPCARSSARVQGLLPASLPPLEGVGEGFISAPERGVQGVAGCRACGVCNHIARCSLHGFPC